MCARAKGLRAGRVYLPEQAAGEKATGLCLHLTPSDTGSLCLLGQLCLHRQEGGRWGVPRPANRRHTLHQQGGPAPWGRLLPRGGFGAPSWREAVRAGEPGAVWVSGRHIPAL